jgi:hypothetical protein
MERLPVEVWQQILRRVMETNRFPILATSCNPYTFLGFIYLHSGSQRLLEAYFEYLEQRRCLRLVCRAWNDFVIFTNHRWLRLEEKSPMYELDSTTTTRAKGGVGPVEELTTKIFLPELVTPILSWASHILNRPSSQSPLRAYHLHLYEMPVPGYNPFDNLLVETTTTHDLECTNTNTTLRLLSISALGDVDIPISFSQICRTFTGLRSLFLGFVNTTPQQTLTLAHLEVLYVLVPSETLLESMETWAVPALRHVYLGYSATPLTRVVDRFLGRYAHQIESLVLCELPNQTRPLLDLPSGFWAQFTALRLLGVGEALAHKEWSGWSVVPPPAHPCRYLVSSTVRLSLRKSVVDDIRSRWTWHDGVRLVVGNQSQYYVVKNIRDDPSIENMEKTTGVLPEL